MDLPTIVRRTIESALDNHKFEIDDSTKKKFSEEKASFVTLIKGGQLRGCIGSLEATQELWKDIQENAINAAFKDPRFYPVTKEELRLIDIEVSVLTKPKKLESTNEYNLLNKLDRKMGIILSMGNRNATFLPQVWDEIPDKVQFMEHLSMKAGLRKDSWKNKGIEIRYYFVEKIRG